MSPTDAITAPEESARLQPRAMHPMNQCSRFHLCALVSLLGAALPPRAAGSQPAKAKTTSPNARN